MPLIPVGDVAVSHLSLSLSQTCTAKVKGKALGHSTGMPCNYMTMTPTSVLSHDISLSHIDHASVQAKGIHSLWLCFGRGRPLLLLSVSHKPSAGIFGPTKAWSESWVRRAEEVADARAAGERAGSRK